MRILLIEDDEHLVWTIKTNLEKHGYAVDFEKDGQKGQHRAVSSSYDLILLDIMLPVINGYSLCKNIRSKGIETPVLMLTARYQESDRIRGLDCGADDYLSKPFSYPELYARIRALIRRSYGHSSVEIRIDRLCIDTAKRTVNYRGREVTLTAKEYSVLEYLAMNRNGIVTQNMIDEHIWGTEGNVYSNVVEVIISRIRKKLDPDNRETIIRTVKGLGYSIKDEKS